MNKELVEILKLYSTGTHAGLSSYLVGKSKDTLIGILKDKLKGYGNFSDYTFKRLEKDKGGWS